MPVRGRRDPWVASRLAGTSPIPIDAIDVDQWGWEDACDLLEDASNPVGTGRKAVGQFAGHRHGDAMEFRGVVDGLGEARGQGRRLFPHRKWEALGPLGLGIAVGEFKVCPSDIESDPRG